MITRDYIDKINRFYYDNKIETRDIDIISYYGDILKIGLCWDITDPYDEAIILENVDLISCPTHWISDVNRNFISLVEEDSDEFSLITKRYSTKYKEGYDLLRIEESWGEVFYFSAKNIRFINKKLSIQEILNY
ncbi:hypothetical protein [Bartonella sp. HY038]|uniref:hypothetical protein n=1 Tax=Bartonella sp. HY038 TaxID=2759660 RepID=UPI0015FAD664|nr:hypothetical protein [Bartonella sp. HY038]